MIPFLSIGALLALLALGLLTRPLWWRARAGTAPAQDAAVAALRRQIEQLSTLHASGALADVPYREARDVLEKRLVDIVVSTPTVAAAPAAGADKGLLAALTVFVLLITGAGYAWLGTPQGLNPEARMAQAPAGEGGGHSVTREQIEAMLEGLAARLKDKPDDPDGWAMLGRSYAVLGRHTESVAPFKQALSLRPNDAVLVADYADALAAANGRSLEGEPSRLVEQALKLDPNNLKALSLAGTAAFNREDFAGAIRHWEKLAQLAPGGDMVQQVQGGIDEARRRMGGGAAPTPAAAVAQANAGPAVQPAPTLGAAAGADSVSGTVTLAPSLAGKAAPTDTLFVFARAAEGPRMPLAILRKQVKDLPLSFKLDDSMAMSPAAKLSSTARVIVGARISKAGDALPKPGDLQGFSPVVAGGATGLKIEIGETVER
jgi:cytochrome c-type biogenesis protein CcmH